VSRPGPFFFIWNPNSHVRHVMGQVIEPENQQAPARFARAAVRAQPGDYARVVVKDLARFIDPNLGADRPESGNSYLDFHVQPAPSADNIKAGLDTRYAGVQDDRRSMVSFFDSYQRVFALPGLWLLLCGAVALAGIAAGRGAARAASALFLVGALALYVGAVATWSYDVRYGVPPLGLLSVAGVLGLAALLNRAQAVGPAPRRGVTRYAMDSEEVSQRAERPQLDAGLVPGSRPPPQ
jgi:hypothetical protein